MNARGRLLVVGAAVTMAIAAAVVVTRSTGRTSTQWDPRIEPIARFVERTRGLRFEHPVEVRLGPPADAVPIAGPARPADTDDSGTAELAGELRALGLATGDVDLSPAVTPDPVRRVHGLYDPDRDIVFVDTATLTVEARVVLAHELTHALQDQRLHLGDLNTRTDRPNDVVRAVSEGDAVVVQAAYLRSLPPDEQTLYEHDVESESASEIDAVPPVLREESQFPYVFGETFMLALRAAGGVTAADRAFRDPPHSEAEILDAQRFLDGAASEEVRPPETSAPALRPGRPLGQMTLFRMFERAVGYGAWRALRGWEGDNGVVFRRDGAVCAAAAVRVQEATVADFMQAARGWALPSGTVERRPDGIVVLERCDPGPAFERPSFDPDPFAVLTLRNKVIGRLLGAEVPLRLATCVADQAVGMGGAAAVTALEGDRSETPDAMAAVLRSAEATCGPSAPAASGR
ncbi:MAG: hypothetical protein QOC92_790 [Acidimicrobiaceae bacterium]|jgi:hypothetical protein